MTAARFRHRLWALLCKSRRVCGVNAYTLVVNGDRCWPFIDADCHRDRDTNRFGHCYCGKLMTPECRAWLAEEIIDGGEGHQ